jgi:Trk K+ transport system NAD-binding subunit
VELTEVEILGDSPLVGCTVVETESRHGVVVVAHRPTGGHEFSSPRSFEGVLSTGDIIIVLGDRQSIAGVQGRGGRSG